MADLFTEQKQYHMTIEQAQKVLNELRETYLTLPESKKMAFIHAFDEWRKSDAEN